MNNLQSAQTALESQADGWEYFDLDTDTCGPVECTLPVIQGAVYTPSTNPVLQNSTVTISCGPGYTLTGQATITCVNMGR